MEVNGFSYLGSKMTNDGRSFKDITSSSCPGSIAFNKKKSLFSPKEHQLKRKVINAEDLWMNHWHLRKRKWTIGMIGLRGRLCSTTVFRSIILLELQMYDNLRISKHPSGRTCDPYMCFRKLALFPMQIEHISANSRWRRSLWLLKPEISRSLLSPCTFKFHFWTPCGSWHFH